MVRQLCIATSSAQQATLEIALANSRALFSHVFFSQSALATTVLLIGPSMPRDVPCEVRTERYINANRTAFLPVFGLQAEGVLCTCDPDSRTIVDRNGLLEETTLLEKAQCRSNNPQHCHNDGGPDFGERYSGVDHRDENEMQRRDTS